MSARIYEQKGEFQLNAAAQSLRGSVRCSSRSSNSEATGRRGAVDPARKGKRFPCCRSGSRRDQSDRGRARDISLVLGRRFEGLSLQIYAVRVQGATAGGRSRPPCQPVEVAMHDVVLIVRGGGSLEDLWAFNEEVVARAVAGMHDSDDLRRRP